MSELDVLTCRRQTSEVDFRVVITREVKRLAEKGGESRRNKRLTAQLVGSSISPRDSIDNHILARTNSVYDCLQLSLSVDLIIIVSLRLFTCCLFNKVK